MRILSYNIHNAVANPIDTTAPQSSPYRIHALLKNTQTSPLKTCHRIYASVTEITGDGAVTGCVGTPVWECEGRMGSNIFRYGAWLSSLISSPNSSVCYRLGKHGP